MAFPAFDLDLHASAEVMTATACLFLSCCAWTMVYDTIYAAQDVKDDSRVGIRSSVVRHQNDTRKLLMGAASTQIALLCCTGVAVEANALYFISTCLGTTLILEKNGEEC